MKISVIHCHKYRINLSSFSPSVKIKKKKKRKNLDHKKCVLRFEAGPKTERFISNCKQKKTL